MLYKCAQLVFFKAGSARIRDARVATQPGFGLRDLFAGVGEYRVGYQLRRR